MKNPEIKFTDYSIESLISVFEKNGITMPRRIRINSMKEVLEPLHKRDLKEIIDRMNDKDDPHAIIDSIRYHRLKRYENLAEHQLENEMKFYNDEKLNEAYYEKLWKKIAENLATLEAKEAIFSDFNNLEKVPEQKKLPIRKYNSYFDGFFVCRDGAFDGVGYEEAVDHFVNSSNKRELFDLAAKYKVDVPKYLKRVDLQQRAKDAYEAAGKLNDEVQVQIDNGTAKTLKAMLADLGADSKSHITKEDIIEKIIAELKTRKKEAKDLEPEPVVVEEVKEEVVPVLVPEEKVIREMVASGVDYSNYLEQIIKNQEEMIAILKEQPVMETAPSKVRRNSSDHMFNFIVMSLIVVVIGVWIAYAITTVFA